MVILMPTESPRYRQIMSRLKLRHLRLIDAIVDAKSVSAAAATLNVTQPAASKSLREIEHIFGVSLFTRGPKGLTLTMFGRSVVAHSKAIQSEIRHVTEEIEAIDAGTSGVITVGSMLVSLPILLPAALRLLRKRDIRVPVRVIEGAQDVLMEELRRGAADLLVGRLTPIDTNGRLVQEVLLYEPIVVVAAGSHPLAKKAAVSYRDLAQASWILPPSNSIVHGPVMQLFAQHGFSKPRAYVESTSFLMVRTLLMDNELVAALPLSVVKRDLDSGDFAALPVRFPHEPLAVGITIASDRALTPATSQLMSCLREAAKSLPAMIPPERMPHGKRAARARRNG